MGEEEPMTHLITPAEGIVASYYKRNPSRRVIFCGTQEDPAVLFHSLKRKKVNILADFAQYMGEMR